MKIKDLPKIDRPREKLAQKGPQNLKAKFRSILSLPKDYYRERGSFVK